MIFKSLTRAHPILLSALMLYLGPRKELKTPGIEWVMALCWVDSNLWSGLPTISPKIQNHEKCLLHIQDATKKKKLAPDRSGNVMVSPEKVYFLESILNNGKNGQIRQNWEQEEKQHVWQSSILLKEGMNGFNLEEIGAFATHVYFKTKQLYSTHGEFS